jgi:hypothetical protein
VKISKSHHTEINLIQNFKIFMNLLAQLNFNDYNLNMFSVPNPTIRQQNNKEIFFTKMSFI